MNGLRLGTPELVRWGVTEDHVAELAGLLKRLNRHGAGEQAQQEQNNHVTAGHSGYSNRVLFSV